MKKTGFLFFCLCLSILVEGQTWLEIGGKALVGVTGYYNENIINDPEHDFNLNAAISYGGAFGINFGEVHGLSFEGLYGKHLQAVTFGDDFIGNQVRNEVQWSTFEAYLLYRLYSRTGLFLEAGPKMSFVREVTQEFGTIRLDVEGVYEDQYLSAVFGFGGLLAGSEFIALKMGIRLEYAIDDFVTNEGQALGYPSPYSSYETYRETHPFRGTVYLELTFPLGRLGKQKCGLRGFMLSGPK